MWIIDIDKNRKNLYHTQKKNLDTNKIIYQNTTIVSKYKLIKING